MENKRWIRETFDVFMMDETKGEPLASAFLVFTLAITEAVERLETIISRGVRYGLFGANPVDATSLDDTVSKIVWRALQRPFTMLMSDFPIQMKGRCTVMCRSPGRI